MGSESVPGPVWDQCKLVWVLDQFQDRKDFRSSSRTGKETKSIPGLVLVPGLVKEPVRGSRAIVGL